LQLKTFRFAGGSLISRAELFKQHPHILLDALIGYGLKSGPSVEIAEMIEWANNSAAPILALDIPSGLDATDGNAPGVVIRPRWTMTLALPKTGLLPAVTGILYLADIGIPKEAYERMRLDYQAPFENQYRIHLEQLLAWGSWTNSGVAVPLLPGSLQEKAAQSLTIASRDFKHALVGVNTNRLSGCIENNRTTPARLEVVLDLISQVRIYVVVDVVWQFL
jgi:hypothetical protein